MAAQSTLQGHIVLPVTVYLPSHPTGFQQALRTLEELKQELASMEARYQAKLDSFANSDQKPTLRPALSLDIKRARPENPIMEGTIASTSIVSFQGGAPTESSTKPLLVYSE